MNNIYKDFINLDYCDKNCEADSVEPRPVNNNENIMVEKTQENDFWNFSEEDILELKRFCLRTKENINEIKEKYKNNLFEKIDSFFSTLSDVERSANEINFPTLHDFKEIAYCFIENETPENKGYVVPLFSLNYDKMNAFFGFCDYKTKNDILDSCRDIFYSCLESNISLTREVNKRFWFYLLRCYTGYGRDYFSTLPKEVVIRKFKENFGITVWYDGYTYLFPFNQEDRRKFSEKVEEEMFLMKEEMEV